MSSILGSSFSSKGAMKLSIELDNNDEVLRGGGQLRGNVILKVDQGTTGSEVEITLKGKEKSIRKKGPIDMCHQHVFFTYTDKVRDSIQKVLVGPASARIPFVIDLPEDLPSSSVYRIGLGDVGFSVQYKLTVKLGKSHSNSIPVRIAAAPLKHCGDSSFLVHPTAQTIFSMNGTKQGSISVAASVQATSIWKGENIKLALSCRNDSSVKIQRVEAKVVELLNWGSHEKYTKTKVNKETLVKIDDIDLPGLQKENEGNYNIIDSNYRTVEEQTAIHKSMERDLVSGFHEIDIACPFRSRDTYAGVLVDVRHYLKITFVTRYSFFGAYPSIKIPLKIGLPSEIPRVYALEQSAVAMTKVLPSHTDDLPLAAAVCVPEEEEQAGAIEFPKVCSRGLETPVAMEKKIVLQPAALLTKERGKDVNTSLRELVPMLPS